MPATGSRWSPEFDGRRRVRISDLIEADLLRPGQTLFYRQRRGEAPHEAVVTERGRLRLPDGREFDTPSGAGTAVSRISAVPGWAAWRLEPDGTSLHELRARLLGQAATAPADPASDDLPGFLQLARESAVANDPYSLILRDLLTKWGADSLDRDVISRIMVDLGNAGLTTEPDFRAVGPDRTLRLILPRNDEGAEEEDDDARDIGLTLGHLVSTKAPLLAISPSDGLAKARTQMEINDYSQLPVLVDPYTLDGVVSWKTIGRWHRPSIETPALSDVISREVRIFGYDVLLRDALDALKTDDFILVRDYDRQIIGIITPADVVETYDSTTTPFILIGEVDQELRQILRNTFNLPAVRRVCGNSGITSFDKLTMFHYETLLNDPECWAELNWGLDREAVTRRLSELRRIRNRVMHFNADLVSTEEVHMLRNFLTMLRRYAK
ncbi:CBS domain-containing protein [Actinoplanes rectilineatus]|uniref:restriction system modified-DNA reader domain-containing protein n=1 Tax=Actinoplanes rectilineatus TaxID=113571 RepID=UPI0005F2DE1B|nr:CBS domain-containing protein [Actinoplanes rectilineatus]